MSAVGLLASLEGIQGAKLLDSRRVFIVCDRLPLGDNCKHLALASPHHIVSPYWRALPCTVCCCRAHPRCHQVCAYVRKDAALCPTPGALTLKQSLPGLHYSFTLGTSILNANDVDCASAENKDTCSAVQSTWGWLLVLSAAGEVVVAATAGLAASNMQARSGARSTLFASSFAGRLRLR